MTVKLLAVEKLKEIRDHLNTSGYPTHLLITEIDVAIDAIQEYKEPKPPADK